MIAERPHETDDPAATVLQTLPPVSTLAVQPGADFSIARSLLLDQAYDEFCRRREAGEDLDPDAYCARYPSMRVALARLLDVHLFLEEKDQLAEVPEIRWPEVGETFLEYRLLLELGKGAFARVFLATEPRLGDRLVAVKVAYRGAREAEVLGRIQHPNIVPVHSVHEDEKTGLTAVCMAYVGSSTLCDVLDRAFAPPEGQAKRLRPPATASVIVDAVKNVPYPLDPSARQAAPDSILQGGTFVDGVRLIGARIADALAYIHGRGINHRDLKPSNVLMSPEGVPMLLDFNLCADAQEPLNRLGGTMLYMSPEQLRATDLRISQDLPALDDRSDIFSLGVILYQLATGAHPFGPVPLKLPCKELWHFLLEGQQKGARPAHQVNPDIDPAFSRLIQRCLATDPNARPQTASEIAVELRRALKPLPRTNRWVRRNRFKVLAAMLLGAAVGLAGLTYAMTLPSYGERELEAGRRCYQDAKYDEAIEHYNHVLQADPKNADILFARARAHQQMGDYNLAMQGYQEADNQKSQGRAKAALGYCLNLTQGTAGAGEFYESAIKAEFGTAPVYNNLGATLLKRGKRPEARTVLNKAIELDPALQAAYHNRAYLALMETQTKASQLKLGKTETQVYRDLTAGIADAQKAIGLGLGSAELYRDAARVCALGAKVENRWVAQAVEYLQEAVKQGLDPAALRKDFLFNTLQADPDFRKLADRPATGATLPFTSRFVDPILDR